MDSRTARRLILPATLAVTTFIAANACQREPEFCVDIESQKTCESAEGCAWLEDAGLCENACGEIQTEEACEATERCAWYPDGQSSTGTGTGTGGEDPDGNPGECGPPFA